MAPTESLSLRQLRAELKKRNLSPSGLKNELVARLKANGITAIPGANDAGSGEPDMGDTTIAVGQRVNLKSAMRRSTVPSNRSNKPSQSQSSPNASPPAQVLAESEAIGENERNEPRTVKEEEPLVGDEEMRDSVGEGSLMSGEDGVSVSPDADSPTQADPVEETPPGAGIAGNSGENAAVRLPAAAVAEYQPQPEAQLDSSVVSAPESALTSAPVFAPVSEPVRDESAGSGANTSLVTTPSRRRRRNADLELLAGNLPRQSPDNVALANANGRKGNIGEKDHSSSGNTNGGDRSNGSGSSSLSAAARSAIDVGDDGTANAPDTKRPRRANAAANLPSITSGAVLPVKQQEQQQQKQQQQEEQQLERHQKKKQEELQKQEQEPVQQKQKPSFNFPTPAMATAPAVTRRGTAAAAAAAAGYFPPPVNRRTRGGRSVEVNPGDMWREHNLRRIRRHHAVTRSVITLDVPPLGSNVTDEDVRRLNAAALADEEARMRREYLRMASAPGAAEHHFYKSFANAGATLLRGGNGQIPDAFDVGMPGDESIRPGTAGKHKKHRTPKRPSSFFRVALPGTDLVEPVADPLPTDDVGTDVLEARARDPYDYEAGDSDFDSEEAETYVTDSQLYPGHVPVLNYAAAGLPEAELERRIIAHGSHLRRLHLTAAVRAEQERELPSFAAPEDRERVAQMAQFAQGNLDALRYPRWATGRGYAPDDDTTMAAEGRRVSEQRFHAAQAAEIQEHVNRLRRAYAARAARENELLLDIDQHNLALSQLNGIRNIPVVVGPKAATIHGRGY